MLKIGMLKNSDETGIHGTFGQSFAFRSRSTAPGRTRPAQKAGQKGGRIHEWCARQAQELRKGGKVRRRIRLPCRRRVGSGRKIQMLKTFRCWKVFGC